MTNPAQQLHEALGKYQQAVTYLRDAGQKPPSMRQCWATALDISEELVPIALGHLVTLVPTIEAAAMVAGPPRLVAAIRNYAPAWISVLAPLNQGLDGPASEVDPTALVGLDLLAALGGETPSQESAPETRIEATRNAVLESMAAVRTDPSLPVELRTLIATRLSDILWAIDHIGVMGADGVRAAAERLAATLAMAEKTQKRKSSFQRAIVAGCLAWTVFSHGKDLQDNYEAWKSMLPEAATVIQELETAGHHNAELFQKAIEAATDIIDAEIVDHER